MINFDNEASTIIGDFFQCSRCKATGRDNIEIRRRINPSDLSAMYSIRCNKCSHSVQLTHDEMAKKMNVRVK